MSEKPGAFDFAGQKARNVSRWSATGWDDLALFIGPNADRFHDAWEQTKEKILAGRGGMAFGFCWPAFLFGFAWFLYRKMWLFAALLVIIPVTIAWFVESPGGSIGVAVATAMFARSLYAHHAVARIAAIRERGGDDAEIARAGGVSLAGGIAGGIVLAILAAAILYPLVENRL